MPSVFVVFPPAAGGNHLKNIIVSCYKDVDALALYGDYKKTAHANMGSNLQYNQVENAVLHQDQIHVLHGHFGEIMSFQQQIRNITSKKFIIISPDSAIDRNLLNERRSSLEYPLVDGYFDSEQVFLYESFMYHRYLEIPMDNIMNISVSEWFAKDISAVLDRLSYFLNVYINKEQANIMHSTWLKANKL